MESAQTALLPATPLQTLLDDIRSQSRSETGKGRAFEGIITVSLPTLDIVQGLPALDKPTQDAP